VNDKKLYAAREFCMQTGEIKSVHLGIGQRLSCGSVASTDRF
jgi:hypothetical protein